MNQAAQKWFSAPPPTPPQAVCFLRLVGIAKSESQVRVSVSREPHCSFLWLISKPLPGKRVLGPL